MSRPNVILILTDDQGYGDMSYTGNPFLRTPALDHLQSQSVRFTDFHGCPMCTPTRGELLTGQDSLRNGATFVCMGRSLLRSDLPTAADLFSTNDYRTGHFGKWHLGDNYPYRPQDRGFQETVWHPGWGITSTPDYFGNDYFNDSYRHRDEIEEFKGYCTDVWFDQAIKWIENCNNNNDSFFAYIATNAPHGPLWVPDHYRTPYQESVSNGALTPDHASFFAMIACIDENLSKLNTFLHQKDLYENTILIFMTDNGTAHGEQVFNAGMRGKKCSLYEGGHRVPCLMRWPAGGIPNVAKKGLSGQDITDVTRTTDIVPTLVDLCELSISEDFKFDGISLANVARGTETTLEPRIAVVQYGHPVKNTGSTKDVWDSSYTEKYKAAILWNRWRLVGHKNELFDLLSDPGQETDIGHKHPEVVKKMLSFYDEWWDDVGDNLEIYQPITIGSAKENPIDLSSADWAGVSADNQGVIRKPAPKSGTWHVNVSKSGNYCFSFRRWPKESGLSITAQALPLQGFDGGWPVGAALPVASAWMRAGDVEATKNVTKNCAEVSFCLPLELGSTDIKSWWIDQDGNHLAGAYYLSVEHVE